MKRKILSLVLCGCLVAGMLPAMALAENSQSTDSSQCGDNLTWSFDEATKTVTISGTGDMYSYQTPEAGDANIGPWKDLDFNTLVVEEGVTSIGWDAFKNLPNLTSVSLPNTLKTMDSSFPFTGLTSVTIPEGVTSINNAFWGCSDLTSVTIPDTVTSMQMSFIECFSLTSIDIPDSVTDLTGTFQGCTGLTEVTIPSSITSIIYSFAGCTSLTSVTIPATVTSIGEYSFTDCDKLTTINYTGTQEQWEAIQISESGNDALAGATIHYNYASDVPTSGTCGDNLTWKYDEATKTLTISGTGDMWDYQTPEAGDANTGPWKDLDFNTLVVEEGVTSIGWDAFKSLPNLTSISLPNTLKTMDSSFPFTGVTSVTIPEGVTSINNAFWGCSDLTSVTISGTVTSMQASFVECSGLTSIDIPDSVTNINGAFQGCTGLTSVTIPDSVTSIIYAFVGCTNLTTVNLPTSLTSIGSATFYGCSSLAQISIPDSVTSIPDNAFFGCSSLTQITIPDGVTSIGAWAFTNCSSLTQITIPDKVTSISDYTFASCSSLTEITIPDSVTSIGGWAFIDADALKTINYTGTQAQWEKITIDDGNAPLTSATIHYNYGTVEPSPEPEQPTPPITGGETTTQNKVDVTISGDKAETTVGGVDIVLGNAGKVFEDGTVVTVEKVTQGTIYDMVKKALDKVVAKMDNVAIFEFTATLDGKTVQPDGTLTVTFDIPKGLTASNLKMFYVSEDGKYEEVKISVDSKANTVTANLEHFSTYVLANVDSDSGVPDTGDTSALTLYVCVLAMAMAGLTILLVNKRRA